MLKADEGGPTQTCSLRELSGTHVKFGGEFLMLVPQRLRLVQTCTDVGQIRRQLVNTNLKRIIMLQ